MDSQQIEGTMLNKIKLIPTYDEVEILSWLSSSESVQKVSLIVVTDPLPEEVGTFISGLASKSKYLLCKNLNAFLKWDSKLHNGFIYSGSPLSLCPDGQPSLFFGKFVLLFKLLNTAGFGCGPFTVPIDVPRILVSSESYISVLQKWKMWLENTSVQDRGFGFPETEIPNYLEAIQKALLFINELRIDKQISETERTFIMNL